jgi:hypothetical protein
MTLNVRIRYASFPSAFFPLFLNSISLNTSQPSTIQPFNVLSYHQTLEQDKTIHTNPPTSSMTGPRIKREPPDHPQQPPRQHGGGQQQQNQQDGDGENIQPPDPINLDSESPDPS